MKIKIILSFVLINLLLMPNVWTAPKKEVKKSEVKKIEAAVPAQKDPSNKSEDVQALFNTLNETLEENRKIHIALKEVQEGYQKKAIENEDLKSEMSKLEGLALERNQELKGQAQNLEEKLKKNEAMASEFEKEKKSFNQEKEMIQKESAEVKAENKKLKTVLETSVLEEEKVAIIKIASENDVAAKRAADRLNVLNFENQSLKNGITSAQYERGNILFQLKRYPEAVAAYKKVLEYDVTNAWAYHNIAVIEDFYLNDPNSAYLHYQQYLSYKPFDEEAEEIRRRVLDINMLQKVAPNSPLKADFDKFHQESRNAKV